MDKLADANSHFPLDLFQKLKEAHPTGNLFFSPFCLSAALSTIVLGARLLLSVSLPPPFPPFLPLPSCPLGPPSLCSWGGWAKCGNWMHCVDVGKLRATPPFLRLSLLSRLPTLEACLVQNSSPLFPYQPVKVKSPRALPPRQFQSPARVPFLAATRPGICAAGAHCASSIGAGLLSAAFPFTTMDKLANANSQFALDLFQKLKEAHPTGNLFFSPFSLSSALAMIVLGARGNTASELLKTLHFDAVEDFHSVFHTLNTEINRSNAPYILKLANRLYGEKSFNFLSDFLISTQNLYGAELSPVDFSNAPGKAKQEINQWVEQQTEGKIHELLPEGSVNEMTKLVLVNAVYFKGNWAEAFKEKDTKDMPFRLNKREKKNVKMMFMKEKLPFGYIPECKCRVLELPYKGKDLSMIILLPDNIEDNSTGLEQLEQQLTLEKLQEWTQSKNMNSRWDVCVHLPKFQLEENYDLKSYFAALGLLDVFDSGKANLSGMSGSPDLHVSKIVHKSFLEVNEVGTEAAAATAATLMLICARREEDFNADHPFLFFIRHNPTNTILFLGRFASP